MFEIHLYFSPSQSSRRSNISEEDSAILSGRHFLYDNIQTEVKTVGESSSSRSVGSDCRYQNQCSYDEQGSSYGSKENYHRSTNFCTLSNHSKRSCDCSAISELPQKHSSTDSGSSRAILKTKSDQNILKQTSHRQILSDRTNTVEDGTRLNRSSAKQHWRFVSAEDKENRTQAHHKVRPLDQRNPQVDHGPRKDMKKSHSLEDIMEPLNVQRLRPIRQKTRNVVLSILDDETVCLEFIKSKSGEMYVTEVIRVSTDGNKVTCYQPNGRDGVPLLAMPADIPKSAVSYAFSGLPQRLWKKYQYADKFVRLVRMKSPKVSYCFVVESCKGFES